MRVLGVSEPDANPALHCYIYGGDCVVRNWLQRRDLNPRSSAYEADEMPLLHPAK